MILIAVGVYPPFRFVKEGEWTKLFVFLRGLMLGFDEFKELFDIFFWALET